MSGIEGPEEEATLILKGKAPLPPRGELKALIEGLKARHWFSLTRRVLSKAQAQPSLPEATERPSREWIVQQLALATYQDEELSANTRFADALALLEEIGLRKPDEAVRQGVDPKSLAETLALGGAVYKRRWEQWGQLEDLHQAYTFYRAAWDRDPKQDQGYGGVNAAYLLDVLASRARTIALRAGIPPEGSPEVKTLEEKARTLRWSILNLLTEAADHDPRLKDEHWYRVTMAELHFGLARYEEAGEWLALAAQGLELSEWKRQTTFKQLVSLARLQRHPPPKDGSEVSTWSPPWQALHRFLGDGTALASSCYRGKVGLALSGGGFRASLFHLGVLARLAEMNVLGSVEALSTVSGGSIVGAHYYLEVQALLEERHDRDIGRDDYIRIVSRLGERFLAGVQKNLRMRTLSDLRSNVRMIFKKEYSRSHRLGELYERELYRRIGDGNDERTEPRAMRELLITPQGTTAGERFDPKFSNWRRRAKVPVLLLNATSLNSGRNWRFTARSMGEPPSSTSASIDLNERYRRLWYEDAPKDEHKAYRLGHAVAASACVPGLFSPLVLEGVYPARTVRLVDGGVHDNQGVQGILDAGCTFVLCSDASGQMEADKQPSDSLLGVPLRSNSILMHRVRGAQYQDLASRLDSHALEGLFFIHLKKDLDSLPVDWIDCKEPTNLPGMFSCTTCYGVDKDLQRKIAAIRTDLDSFSEVEACSIMLSGYLMTEHEFRELNRRYQRESGASDTWGGFDIDAPRAEWPFLKLEGLVRQPPDGLDPQRTELGRQLEIGCSLAFKVWKLSRSLRAASWAGAVAAALLLGWLVYANWSTELVSVSVGGLVSLVGIIALTTVVPLVKRLRPQKMVNDYLSKIVVAGAGWIFANLHLRIFDPWFLRLGSLSRLLGPKKRQGDTANRRVSRAGS